MSTKVLVLGSNFGGLTAALALRYELDAEQVDDVDITVLSPSDRFLFNPSLIWLPFGKRSSADITFPVAPTLEMHRVHFVQRAAELIDTDRRVVVAGDRDYRYDYLVVATGYRNDFEVAPGLGPGGNAVTITTLEDAEKAAEAWRALLEDPGDVVVVATQGASCFGAAYEFLFNASYQLRRHGLKRNCQLTYVTAEPFLGHFGMGGLPHGETLLKGFFKKERIHAVLDTSIEYVDATAVRLTTGRDVPFRYAMVVPPFLGQEVVAKSGLADGRGYVPVRPTYQSLDHDDVYAVGIAAAVTAPWHTPTPVGVPKTGFPTEEMAHVAARNIAAQIRGEAPTHEKAFGDIKAVCVMDAGNNGVIILADKMLPPRHHAVLIPGPQAHLMKLGFEKYYLWKARNGLVNLP
jgi:sulfide:quinone oxidoreductase